MTNLIHEEIVEVKDNTRAVKAVENLQLVGLALTILGQILVRYDLALIAQTLWLVSNCIALGRDFYLKRPLADKIKNASLTALTLGLIISLIIV